MNKAKLIQLFLFFSVNIMAQSFMMNPYGREHVHSLNGKWNILIDPFCQGEQSAFFKNKKPQSKTDFVEYSFENGLRLEVPGDFNSQLPELKYYEGNIWYQRYFNTVRDVNSRKFLYFAGVNYSATIWLNGVLVGKHEGGFTPFQIEVSSLVKDGKNDLIVMVNNSRRVDGIPAMNFDWWNYGGITRDVMLIETPQTYISDYKVQLKKGSQNLITGHVKLDGASTSQTVVLNIPELKVKAKLITDSMGMASFELKVKPQLWEPDAPKLYAVNLSTETDQVNDEIGFRTIETKGSQIVLNGKPIFLKGVNFHEEIPQRLGRAYSDADASMILNEVKALGCNFARTAHYPQNERIVRMAEKMGILLWEEIPLWQGIEFSNPVVLSKATSMLREMIYRDKNRASVIFWSIANETQPSEYRDKVLIELSFLARQLDDTRLITGAFNNLDFDRKTSTFKMNDKFAEVLDVVGINKYIWWYEPFTQKPEEMKWSVLTNKPLIMSEFGGEALSGQHGAADEAHSWSEEFQEELYKKNLVMFQNIPNLCGTSPWILFDFRAPNRLHSQNQEGWNRKGLLSDKGQRKKAWYVMKHYYDETKK